MQTNHLMVWSSSITHKNIQRSASVVEVMETPSLEWVPATNAKAPARKAANPQMGRSSVLRVVMADPVSDVAFHKGILRD